MNQLLEKIIAHEPLTESEASSFIHGISEDEYTTEEISGMLVGIQMRGIQLSEINGFRSALLALSLPIEIDASDAIDLCGTGGDGKNTFNISTTTAFVLSAMGIPVVKHGNYGVSSLCGSSNVLEYLGISFSEEQTTLQQQLAKTSICFLHAPLFHPTIKKVASVRKNLATRTLFNCLGPLVNPAQPAYQLTGTFSLELARIYQHLLKNERKEFTVAYGMDRYDEITLTDDTRLLSKSQDTVVSATTFGIPAVSNSDLFAGNSIHEAAKIMVDILNGNGTHAQQQVVAANSAVALQLYHPTVPLKELFQETHSFIAGGYAKHQLKKCL